MSFLKHYLDYTAPQEATERVHTWVGLSVVAAAVERKVWLNRRIYTLFPNLYTFIVGPSGVVRKSTSTAIGVDLLRDLDNMNILSDRMTAAALIQQIGESSHKFEWNGKQLQQSASYVYASELNVFLGEVYGSITELLTTFYDCIPNDCNKPWSYNSIAHGSLKVYGPCLNILGATTPVWLTRSLPPSEMEGGFGSRVIFVVEDVARHANALLGKDDTNMQDVEAQRRLLLADLRRIHELVGPMMPDDSLRTVGQKWYSSHQKALQSNTDLRFSGYYGRKFDTVLKVAMLLSVSQSSDLVLTAAHFEESLALLQDIEKRMFNAFGAAGENPNSALMEKIWSVLVGNKYIGLSKLTALMRRDATAERVLLVLRDLEVMQRARRHHDKDRQDIFYSAIEPDKVL